MPHSEIDKLLSEDDWIRRLARRLVPDPALADDLAQDAWVAALERPGEARALRPWLGGILRNLVRSSHRSAGRREDRERLAARAEALPSAAELVEEVTLRREVADQLLELEEPYRSTLYLRFFRDLSLKKIARQTDVPVSTVHDRVQRGLEQLRASMDRAHGGDRRAWALAILPLAQPSSGLATTVIASVVMSTTFKVAAGIAVAGGALGLWIQNRESQALETPAVIQAPAEVAAEEGGSEATLDLVSGSAAPREALEAAAVEPEVAAEPASGATLIVHGRVIDATQNGIPGVDVRFVEDSSQKIVVSTETDLDGRFSVERDPIAYEGWRSYDPLMKKTAGGSFVVDDLHYATLAMGVSSADELLIVVAPKMDFRGTVVDDSDAPVEGAHLTVRVRLGLRRELGFSEFFSHELDALNVETNAAGEFFLSEACGGDQVFLDVAKAGYEAVEFDLPEESRRDLRIVLPRLEDSVEVTGRVIDEAGAPLARAQVSLGNAIELTDENGEFVLDWSRAEARSAAPVSRGADGVWRAEEAPLYIAAVKPGHLPVRQPLDGADLHHPIVLQMGPAPLAISGRVVDESGQPLEGIGAWARNLTTFGNLVFKQGEMMSRISTTIEEELRAGGERRGVVTGADGTFSLTGLLEQDYDLQIFDTATGQVGEGWMLPAGTDDAELVLPHDSSLRPVAGRVVSLGGEPIADVSITVIRELESRYVDRYGGPPDTFLIDQKTDADGRFEFPRLATEHANLMLFCERIFFSSIDLAEHEDLGDLELVEPLLCELQVELVEPDLADAVQVLDDDGQALLIVESFGAFVAQGENADVENGRTGVLRVPETAVTLVLRKGDEEVTRRRLVLDPAERTVVRP